MLQSDTDTDTVDTQYTESDIADILTKEPGLTDLVQFRIQTGLHPPIPTIPHRLS